MPSTTSIREHLATALHADRDHTRDGVQLGAEPICNCYTLADVAIAALGGVSPERNYGTAGAGIFYLDYPMVNVTSDPKWHTRERLGFATPWLAEIRECCGVPLDENGLCRHRPGHDVSGSTGQESSSTSNDTNASKGQAS